MYLNILTATIIMGNEMTLRSIRLYRKVI